MSISSISSTLSPSDIQGVTPSAISPTSSLTSADAANGVNVDISKPGQLFSQLSSLAQSDPDQFKSVTADIAQKLKDAAGSATGSQADMLNKIADRFQTASQSGNISDLAPPSGGKAHGHRHHGGHQGQGGGSSTGADGGESVGQIVQSIISGALSSASSSAASTTADTTSTLGASAPATE